MGITLRTGVDKMGIKNVDEMGSYHLLFVLSTISKDSAGERLIFWAFALFIYAPKSPFA